MSSMISEATPIAFDDALPEVADVVVVGGGIAGVASAYYLAQRGRKVVLCEKGRIAGEQSSRNWGWVRQQGRDRAELPIMMEANRLWQGLAAETGESDLSFKQSGCLYLADSPEKLARFEDWREVALEHQLDTRMLSRQEIEQLYPDVSGDFVGGMLTATDGCAEPFVAVPAFARAAQRAGVSVIEGCAVRTLDVQDGKVAGVVTEKGRISCDQVLLAGGVWSTHFAANCGISLPQLGVRSTAGRTGPAPDAYGPNISSSGITLRRRADGGYTVSTGDLAEHYLAPNSFRYLTKFVKLLKVSAKDVRIRFDAPAHFPGNWSMPRRWTGDDASPFERMRVVNPAPSQEVVRRINARLEKRFPKLAGVGLAEAWAGLIDVTPDAVPVLGETSQISGFYIATGLSGHGFGIGPAVGRVMADMMSGRGTGYDLARFRESRFRDGSPIIPGPY